MSSSSTKTLLAAVVQPSIVSLFSSTGSDPLALFSSASDKTLPADSFIHLLHDRLSSPPPASPKALLRLPALDGRDDSDHHLRGRELEQSVLHIQSPTIPTTYIQCPPISSNVGSSAHSSDLGIKHPWIHIQIRNLAREWSFEVGIVDQAGRVGVIRLSTFQKAPHLKSKPDSPPLLLLPLSFPARSTNPLTPWSTINVHFPSILPYFSSPQLLNSEESENANQGSSSSAPTRNRPILPGGTFAHVSYVRVYANCRLRRIWFSEGGPSQKAPWEFELYSVD